MVGKRGGVAYPMEGIEEEHGGEATSASTGRRGANGASTNVCSNYADGGRDTYKAMATTFNSNKDGSVAAISEDELEVDNSDTHTIAVCLTDEVGIFIAICYFCDHVGALRFQELLVLLVM